MMHSHNDSINGVSTRAKSVGSAVRNENRGKPFITVRTADPTFDDNRSPCRTFLAAIRIGLLLLLAFTSSGCRRPSFYRLQADQQAHCLIDQKSASAGITPGEYRVDIDPRSRMYDPNNPDCEPMPPDDPTSHRLMHCVDCKKGEKCWKCLPQTSFVENPGWLEHLPRDDCGQVVLDLQGAVELAILESPRYQSQLETLYLSALDVSFERFRFDTQFFGGSSVFFTADGQQRSGLPSGSSVLDVGRTNGNPSRSGNLLRAERLTATGGTLVAGLANSLMWQFAGPDDYTSNTLLDFSIFQPLLRASGRGRVLERLTISERSLLANVRQMERFRRNFYVSVYSGEDPGQGPSRRGGFFGGSGLEGFSGVGGGGFGRVGGGGGGNFLGGGGGNTGGAGAQGAGGYLGLLQSAQVLRNQRANVAALRDSVLQLEASNEAGRIDRFQVDLARQALYNAQSQLLSSENSFTTSLENFKVTIGLPPELEMQVRDPMLDKLNLLDPALEQLQQQVADSLLSLRELRAVEELQAGGQVVEGLTVPNLPAEELTPVAGQELGAQLNEYLAAAAQIAAAAQLRLKAVQADFQKLAASLPERREQLERLAKRQEVAGANLDPALFDPQQLDRRVDRRQTELSTLEEQLLSSCEQLQSLASSETRGEVLDDLIPALNKLSGQLLELSLAQAGARLETINFQPVDLSAEQALAIASQHRRDWMNARASLVDSWRLIYFNANDLQSDLDLVFSGDLGNVGDNPFNFNHTTGRLRVGLEFDAPLTRLAERNVYRQSLIEYQQARRSYYQFRDRVYQSLRNTLRQIRLNEINFELRRAAVQVAISQVDLTQLRLSEPPKPGETSQFGSTTARDLVQSLSDLLNVQNDFLSVWVNYEVQRLNLEVDLGVMQLTPTGLRLENEIPLETYFAGLPLNTSDLGQQTIEKLQCEPVELLHPDSMKPEPAESEIPGAEPLPAPPIELSEAGPTAGNVQLISAEMPWPDVPRRLPPVQRE